MRSKSKLSNRSLIKRKLYERERRALKHVKSFGSVTHEPPVSIEPLTKKRCLFTETPASSPQAHRGGFTIPDAFVSDACDESSGRELLVPYLAVVSGCDCTGQNTPGHSVVSGLSNVDSGSPSVVSSLANIDLDHNVVSGQSYGGSSYDLSPAPATVLTNCVARTNCVVAGLPHIELCLSMGSGSALPDSDRDNPALSCDSVPVELDGVQVPSSDIVPVPNTENVNVKFVPFGNVPHTEHVSEHRDVPGYTLTREMSPPRVVVYERAHVSQRTRYQLRLQRTPTVNIDTPGEDPAPPTGEGVDQPDENDPEAEVHDLGSLDQHCENCGALFFPAEIGRNQRICCKNGRIRLEPYTPPHRFILDQLRDGPWSAEFRRNILYYNNSLALCSIGVSYDPVVRNGPMVLRLNGIMYHNMNSLLPRSEGAARCGQLFIYDTAIAGRLRQDLFPSCNAELLRELDSIMRETNPYVEMLHMMKDLADNVPDISMYISTRDVGGTDAHRFNAPGSDKEIAVVFTATEDGRIHAADLVVHSTDGRKSKIHELSPLCDAFLFPLLFPSGDLGWRLGLPMQMNTPKRSHVSLLEYYAYRFQYRRGGLESSFVLYARALTQLFVVFAYIRIEKNRLEYLRKLQTNNRAATQIDLQDHYLHNPQDLRPRGHFIKLPSSFPGSPRAMHQHFLDSMEVVKSLGTPDLFITFTSNPKWVEFQRILGADQAVENHPFLVCRVFHLKLKYLLQLITEKRFFGRVNSLCYVVEFQKRGLPHAHIVVILNEEDKIRTPEQVDHFLCAEIPDKEARPILFETVMKMNVHGPCSPARCMRDGKCRFNFPKPPSLTTDFASGSFPAYRRRPGISVQYNGRIVTNQDIVPYNPDLSVLMNAHVNVEICGSARCIKYLYKYIHKGPDMANIELAEELDEIINFQRNRYVSPPEAAYRILEYPMTYCSHTVQRLDLHLPGMNHVYFSDRRDLTIEDIDGLSSTTLLAFFELNRRDDFARTLLYAEIPLYYILKNKKWVRRSYQVKIVARIYSCSPLDKERYALRLLLLHRRGPTCFEDLCHIDDVAHTNFYSAASRLGLYNDPDEWARCLAEAALVQRGPSLRHLFAVILAYCDADVTTLWAQFREDLIEDYIRRNVDESNADQLALHCIRDAFHAINPNRKFLFGLPIDETFEPDAVLYEDAPVDRAQVQENLEIFLGTLNEEQKLAYQSIREDIDSRNPSLHFLDGPAGSGKTYLYQGLHLFMQSRGIESINLAFTGIAASLLPQGTTVHNYFGLPLNVDEKTTIRMGHRSRKYEKLRTAAAIIWDEISLTPKAVFDEVDRFLREVSDQPDVPFGGKILIAGGDFRQCLPIVRNASRSQIIAASVKASSIWTQFHIHSLTRNMRVGQNVERQGFSQWLMNVGNGVEEEVDTSAYEVDMEKLISNVFGDVDLTDHDIIKDRAILCASNEDTFQINERVLQLLPGLARDYFSSDCIEDPSSADNMYYSTEFLHSLTPSGFPRHLLRLKIGCPIILLRNLDVTNGLTNGTRLVVTEMYENLLVGKRLSRFAGDSLVYIPKIDLISCDPRLPIQLRRRTFPVRQAYSITVNKSQGQSLGVVGILLRKQLFSHGQLYVALSRARNPQNLFVCNMTGSPSLKNIVYKEVL
jgi:hypothetical protein